MHLGNLYLIIYNMVLYYHHWNDCYIYLSIILMHLFAQGPWSWSWFAIQHCISPHFAQLRRRLQLCILRLLRAARPNQFCVWSSAVYCVGGAAATRNSSTWAEGCCCCAVALHLVLVLMLSRPQPQSARQNIRHPPHILRYPICGFVLPPLFKLRTHHSSSARPSASHSLPSWWIQ